MNKYILFTNDVEAHSIFYNSIRPETGYKVYKEAIPYLLDLYEENNIKSTFFITGYIAKLYPNIVKMIADRNHEVGSHGLTHEVNQAFDVLSFNDQLSHLKEAKNILEDLCGNEVISFRAPALRVNKDTPMALEEAGFRIDSSISPQRLDFFFSFGSIEKIKRIFSPRKAYFTSKTNLSRRGNSNIIEVPVSSLFIPFVGSLMRSSNFSFRFLKFLLVQEAKYFDTAINYYMHPTEFINEHVDGKIDKVNRRSKSLIKYIFADIVRRKIKLINLGEEAKPIYEKLIYYFNDLEFKSTTIKDYCKIKGLLK